MGKRWLIGAGLVLLLGFAGMCFEPHWYVIGWWRGETFYQGRPTS